MAKEKPRDPSWGQGSEIQFVKGLGTHQVGYDVDRSEREWLKLYISSHGQSIHPCHKKGVKYAQDRLEELNCG